MTSYALTDSGNAERFADRYRGRVRYVPAWKRWHVYDGRHWAADVRGEVDLFAKATVRSIDEEVRLEVDEDRRKKLRAHAMKSEGRAGRENLIALARAELAAAPEDFDRDPLLFNAANGTIDLRTGTLRPHDPADMITRLVDVAYDPAADCPVFKAFVARVLGSDADLITYVQKALGYSLTGSVARSAPC
jgi:putative DNA primase/helicase